MGRQIAIIDWGGTRPGPQLPNVAPFLWAFVHPGMYAEGEPTARLLRVAVGTYGLRNSALVGEMLAIIRKFARDCEDEPRSLR